MDSRNKAKKLAVLKSLGRDINEVYKKYCHNKESDGYFMDYPMTINEFCKDNLDHLMNFNKRKLELNLDWINSEFPNYYVIIFEKDEHGDVLLMENTSNGNWTGIELKDSELVSVNYRKESDEGFPYKEVRYLDKHDLVNSMEAFQGSAKLNLLQRKVKDFKDKRATSKLMMRDKLELNSKLKILGPVVSKFWKNFSTPNFDYFLQVPLTLKEFGISWGRSGKEFDANVKYLNNKYGEVYLLITKNDSEFVLSSKKLNGKFLIIKDVILTYESVKNKDSVVDYTEASRYFQSL